MNRDADILRNMHYGTKHNAFDTIMYLTRLFAVREAITWGIALRESNELIGLRSCFIDSENEPVTIQGQLRHAYRRKGYTAEAYEKIICFLGKIGVKEIKANADKNNTAAIALLNKMGFQAEPRFLRFSINDPNPNSIAFTREIKLNPQPHKATTFFGFKLTCGIARTSLKNGDYDSAYAYTETLLSNSKNNLQLGEACLIKGLVIRATEGNLAAMSIFEKSIELNPTLAQSYVELGICQYNIAWRNQAHENWQKGLELGDERAASLIEKYPA